MRHDIGLHDMTWQGVMSKVFQFRFDMASGRETSLETANPAVHSWVLGKENMKTEPAKPMWLKQGVLELLSD